MYHISGLIAKKVEEFHTEIIVSKRNVIMLNCVFMQVES